MSFNAAPAAGDDPMVDAALSRRQWLERVSVPALGASAAGAFGATPMTAQPSAPSTEPLNGARVYNIRDFGAKGDGKALDTAALQTAIDTCTRDGGGTVLVPAGTFHIEPWSSRATSHCTSPPPRPCSAARTDGSTTPSTRSR